MYEDGLAATGAGALLLGGYTIGLPMILTAAVGLMVLGLFVYRVTTRSRRAETRG